MSLNINDLVTDPEYRPEMVSLKEASARCGMNYYAIRRLCLDGVVAHIRVGSRYYINWPLFVIYLNGQSVDITA